jgi:hypothetical protein
MGAYQTLKSIYKPKYIALNVILAIAYYIIMSEILIAAYHIIIFAQPLSQYLFYAVAVTSSTLMTIGIYAFEHAIRSRARILTPTIGSAVALTASVITSCGCAATPMLLSLTAIGLSGTEIFGLNLFLSNNESVLLFVLTIINLSVITYYINRLSNRRYKSLRKRIR